MADHRRQRQKIRSCGFVASWMLFAVTAALLYFDYVKRIFEKLGDQTYTAIYVSSAALLCSILGVVLHFPHHRYLNAVFAILRIVFVIAGCGTALGDFVLLSYFTIPTLYVQKIAEPQELRSRIQNWMPKTEAASQLNADPLLERHSSLWSPTLDENRHVIVGLTIAIGFCGVAQFVLGLLCALSGCFACSRCCCRRGQREDTDVEQELQPIGHQLDPKK